MDYVEIVVFRGRKVAGSAAARFELSVAPDRMESRKDFHTFS
jgi:hypothetical protein